MHFARDDRMKTAAAAAQCREETYGQLGIEEALARQQLDSCSTAAAKNIVENIPLKSFIASMIGMSNGSSSVSLTAAVASRNILLLTLDRRSSS